MGVIVGQMIAVGTGTKVFAAKQSVRKCYWKQKFIIIIIITVTIIVTTVIIIVIISAFNRYLLHL